MQETELSGGVALERMPRFRESLISDVADIQVHLQLGIDSGGQKQIMGKLEAIAELPCQRCLEAVSVKLADIIQLAVFDSAEQAESKKLEPDWDPWLCEEIKLELAPVIEEQLILCLPIVSYHEDENCIDKLQYQQPGQELDQMEDQERKENPFAVLKALKQDAE